MDLGLTGKRALVTGASRGLGLAIARTLAQEGAAVAMVARTADAIASAARDAAASLPRGATAPVAITGDVGDADATARIVA